MQVYKIQFSFFAQIEKKKKIRIVELSLFYNKSILKIYILNNIIYLFILSSYLQFINIFFKYWKPIMFFIKSKH